MRIVELISGGILGETMSAEDRYALTVMPLKATQDKIRELIKRKKLRAKYKMANRILNKLEN